MSTYAARRFSDDPLVTASAQFTLCRAAPIETDETSPPIARPWGLRDLVPAGEGPATSALRYDHASQVAVLADGTGRAFVDTVDGPPTAPTTQRTDGEDPPSSEDWKNDFAPDAPACPC